MTFTLDLTRILKKAGDKADIAARKISYELFTKVVMKSPVDTGRFRGNWTVSIGSYSPQAYEFKDKRPLGSIPGAGTAMRANAALNGYRAGNPIFITNSLPYAQRLETGWSKQAPTGMVRLSLMEITAKYGR